MTAKLSWEIQKIDNRENNTAKTFDLYFTGHPHDIPPLIHFFKNRHNRLHQQKKNGHTAFTLSGRSFICSNIFPLCSCIPGYIFKNIPLPAALKCTPNWF